MYCVVFGGYDDCLKIMFSWLDGDLNVEDLKDGWILVYLVVWKGYVRCLKLLIRKGGDVCWFDYRGKIFILLVGGLSCLLIIFCYLVGKFNYLFVEISFCL